MKLVKSLLLGSVAGVAAVAGAQAADLPFRKAAPVDYVRVCDWVGQAGYFYIPGSDTCIKIGGAVRFEYAYIDPSRTYTPGSQVAANLGGAVPAAAGGVRGGLGGTYFPGSLKNASGFFARGVIETDVRTQTAYGLLRGFVRLQADRAGGSENTAFGNGAASSAYLDKGYITFAGITAGRVQSFFDFYADNYNYDGIANSDTSTQVLAYTATFGGGFTATISAEEANVRRVGINTVAFGNTAIGANALLPAVFGGTVGYAGERLPDAVAQLSLTQAWGTVQLSAAYHDVNTVSNTLGTAANGSPIIQSATASGFAVQAGIDIKLPMLAAGDELWLQGAYQNGAENYQDSGANFSSGFNGLLLGGFTHLDADAVAIGNGAGTGYRLALAEGFSVMGALHHYFTPQFHDVLYGSYEEISYGAAKNIDWTRGGIGDASEYRIGNQFIFTPVHNLDIGVDVMYAQLNQTLAHERVAGVNIAPTALPAGITKDPNTFEVRLRLNRAF